MTQIHVKIVNGKREAADEITRDENETLMSNINKQLSGARAKNLFRHYDNVLDEC